MRNYLRVLSSYATPQAAVTAGGVFLGGYYLYNTCISDEDNREKIIDFVKKQYRHFIVELNSFASKAKKNWFNISCAILGSSAIYYNIDNASVASRIAKSFGIIAPTICCYLYTHGLLKKECSTNAPISHESIFRITKAVGDFCYIAPLASAAITTISNVVLPAEYKFLVYPGILFINYCIFSFQFYKADPWHEVADNKSTFDDNWTHLVKFSLIVCSVGFISHYGIATATQMCFALDPETVKLGVHEVASVLFAIIFCAATSQALGINIREAK